MKNVWIIINNTEYLVTERTAECHARGFDVDFIGGAEDENPYANFAPPKKYILEERELDAPSASFTCKS